MRLLVHVEGQTEEAFVNHVLAPHLCASGYASVNARLIGNAQGRGGRGGGQSWQSVRRGILRHLKDDRKAISTTIVDYYGMPQGQSTQWPGRREAASRPIAERAATVQDAIAKDVRRQMGTGFNRDRFLPYVSMHEFEALLFSDCDAFAEIMGVPEAASDLKTVLVSFGDPEQINDSKETSPSKRIQRIVERYDKVVFGTLAVEEIGLDVIRRKCRNFERWLTRLENAVR